MVAGTATRSQNWFQILTPSPLQIRDPISIPIPIPIPILHQQQCSGCCLLLGWHWHWDWHWHRLLPTNVPGLLL